jgi:DNA-binding transcriptional ArsR family regulator
MSHLHGTLADTISFAPDIKWEPKRKKKFIGKFLIMFPEIEQRFVLQAGEAQRTFQYIRTLVRYENEARFRQSTLARALGVSRGTIERHVKRLREMGVLIPDPTEEVTKSIYFWRIHPYLGWIGDTEDLDRYMKKLSTDHPFRQWTFEKPQ